jgi:hypothetical protein
MSYYEEKLNAIKNGPWPNTLWTAEQWAAYNEQKAAKASEEARAELDRRSVRLRAIRRTPQEHTQTVTRAVFRNPTQPTRLLLSQAARRVISDEVYEHRASGVETGGVLVGARGAHGITITAATAYSDPRTERARGKVTWRTGEYFDASGSVGCWHTHPWMSDSTCSPGDVETGASMVEEYDLDCHVSLIVAVPGAVEAARRRYEWSAWLFQRDQSGAVIYAAMNIVGDT